MKIDIDRGTIGLPRGNILRLRDASGVTLAVASGTLWVTQDDDLRDYILSAGHSMVITSDGSTIGNALEDAAVRIVPPAVSFAGESFVAR